MWLVRRVDDATVAGVASATGSWSGEEWEPGDEAVQIACVAYSLNNGAPHPGVNWSAMKEALKAVMGDGWRDGGEGLRLTRPDA
jgi:hypothetical protein